MQPIMEADESALKNIVFNYFNTVLPDNADKKRKRDGVYLKGSISEYTKNLIMTFPVLCDNSLTPETASLISKANERYIVSMLQLLFASVQLNGKDGAEILSRVHKNINSSPDIDDVVDYLENLDPEHPFGESAVIKNAIKEIERVIKNPDKSYPVNSLNERSLNDYIVNNVYGKNVILEKQGDEPVDRRLTRWQIQRTRQQIHQSDAEEQRKEAEEERRNNAERRAQAQELRDIDKDRREQNRERREEIEFRQKQQMDRMRSVDMQMDMYSKVLLDSDVKKANELAPTLMVINYNELDQDDDIYTKNTFVAGVKSRLISTDAFDIVERLAAKNRTKLSFLNLIRATSGEIKFIRDFLLCLDQAKIDAKNSVKKGPTAQMWKVLERRATKNNKNKLYRAGNDASAITTLVINQETANLLKKQYKFDIENIRNAKMILEAYNLLSIIICDESIEVAKFIYAGNDTFETQAYSFLEKEGRDSMNSKKMINFLMTNGR